ncbi:TonB-dependent receptor [Prevotella dentasini]
MKRNITGLLIALLCPLLCPAQNSDTLRSQELADVEVIARRVTSKLKRDSLGSLSLDLSFLDNMPKILGNADPIHYTQLLPSVQTNTEMDAGLHVQGCDNSHNDISIDGVPLYNVQHILGLFSVFNASHFSTLRFSSSAFSASASNRLGGYLDMQHADSVPGKAGGDFSLGLISSQGTLRLPMGQRSALFLSGRAAYMNLLYGQWLKVDGTVLKYSFYDANLTWLYHPDNRNTLWLNYYSGNDVVSYDEGGYQYDARLKWGNYMTSLNWERKQNGLTLMQTAYLTTYRNRFRLEESDFSVYLPSSILDYGYKASIRGNHFSIGTDWAVHHIHPQAPSVRGDVQTHTLSDIRQHAVEGSLWGNYKFSLVSRVDVLAGARGSYYRFRGSTYLGADPLLALLWSPRCGLFRLTADVKHQYLHKTGFSSISLPTEFWVSADASKRPQYAYSFSAEYRTGLFRQLLQLSVALYYKRLYHQIEYIGTPIDLLYADYDLNQNIVRGRGENFGLNLMLEKRSGRITGWLSYSLGRALRHYPSTLLNGTYPASHERIHEFNAVATWSLGSRWALGATLVWASGTPFTPPRYFYLQNGNLISQFADHNSARLSTYIRLDVSANYKFRQRNGRESGINLSIYNANCRHNDLFWRLKFTHDEYSYSALHFLPRYMPFLPSISYYVKF